MKIEKVEHPTPESMIENYGEPFELPPLEESKSTIKGHSSQLKSLSSTSAKNTNRWKHDDIPKEKIMDILETERAKIIDKV
jgi:hypothetical protein